jgi:hypothetical protein
MRNAREWRPALRGAEKTPASKIEFDRAAREPLKKTPGLRYWLDRSARVGKGVRASGMSDTSDATAAFFQALGRFLTRFSEIEALMQTTLWSLAGVPQPTAQAVFSGVRTEGAMQFINRIAAAEEWNTYRREELQYVFTQLGLINKLRNNILHYGAEQEGPDAWVVTNKQFVHVPENVSRTIISPTTLEHARHDLDKVETHLTYLLLATSHIPGPDRDQIESVLQRPWRYKPPQQVRGPK